MQAFTVRLEGVVVSMSGRPVAGASIRVVSGDGAIDMEVAPGEQGDFSVEVPPGAYRLTTSAPGFAERAETVTLAPGQITRLRLQLSPPAPDDTITVTASRSERRLDQQIQDVVLLPRSQLENAPVLSIDEALRQVPGFGLFRRTSSLAAHPTAQGVSLRGVGPSGVSRTLVLWDEIPLNDAFGGWVGWNQVPLESIEQVEIMRGAGSELYGSSALGGVLQMISRRPRGRDWSAMLLGGNLGTASLDVFGSSALQSWKVAGAVRALRTNGYHQVPAQRRGSIDRRLGTSFESTWLRAVREAGDWNLGITGSFLHEERQNGTAVLQNQTNLGRLALLAAWTPSASTRLQTTGYWQQSQLESSFTLTTADRQGEFLTSWQVIPSRAAGASLVWNLYAAAHTVSAGGDWRRVSGESDERLYDFAGTRVTGKRIAGGVQKLYGFYGQDLIRLSPRFDLQAALRVDGWNDDAGFLTALDAAGAQRTAFDGPRRWNASPRAGAMFRAHSRLRLRASAYRSFRTPTLNELYRPFRVGNAETRANAALRQESLAGGEVGGDWRLAPALSLRVTGFAHWLNDPVSNVTVLVEPNRIVRERQNLGRVRVSGLEAEWSLDLAEHGRLEVSYLWNDTRVLAFAPTPALVGRRLAQVPLHSAAARLALRPAVRWNVLLQGRLASRQFEDDLNQQPLGYYNLFDARVGFRASESVEVFAQVENLLDRQYLVGRAPVPLQGSPLQAQVGIRIRSAP